MARANEERSGSNSATDHIREKAQEIGSNVREIGGQIGDVAREQYENIRGRAAGYYNEGRRRASEWEEGIEEYIQDRPIHSILMAAGIGLLLGLLWRRR
jgi:ElaB/YqjD/DUF883 family membrane-anchored ribosome-binding protein